MSGRAARGIRVAGAPELIEDLIVRREARKRLAEEAAALSKGSVRGKEAP